MESWEGGGPGSKVGTGCSGKVRGGCYGATNQESKEAKREEGSGGRELTMIVARYRGEAAGREDSGKGGGEWLDVWRKKKEKR